MSSNQPFTRSVLPLSLKCLLISGRIFVLRNNSLFVTHLTFEEAECREFVTMDLVKWPSKLATSLLEQHISTTENMILSDPFLTGLRNSIDTYRLQALI